MPFPRLLCAALTLGGVAALAQVYSGVDPRPAATDYPARAANSAVSFGATLVSPADQQKILGKDWSGGYVVVEVALYPEPGVPLTVAPRDFMLRTGSESVAPVDADTLVPLPKMSGPPPTSDASKVHVRTVDTIGVASGPNGHKTVYTDSQVQVAVGDTPWPVAAPPPPPDKHWEERRALEQMELADAKTAQPIAGYLYFPKPKHVSKNATFELAFYGEAGQLKVTLASKR